MNDAHIVRWRDPWLGFWLIVAGATGLLAFGLAARYTWVSKTTVVPVTGETVLQENGPSTVVVVPQITYSAVEYDSFLSPSNAYLSTRFLTGANAREVDLLVADVVFPNCRSDDNAPLIEAPKFLFMRTIVNRLGENHIVGVYRVRLRPKSKTSVFVICAVRDVPGADSYATRNIEYLPMEAYDLHSKPIIPGFRPVFPQHVGFEVAGNVDISVTGDIAKGPMAHFFERREVGGDSFSLRARWTAIQAQARRDFGLFLAAVISGIAVSALVELFRRLFEKMLAIKGSL